MNAHTFAICAYKDSPYLESCIKSLKKQTVYSSIILCTSTPSPYIQGMADKYGIPVFARDGQSDIQTDWNFAYLLSNLSYYQISQGLGVMETMALWMGIGILYCLFQFLHDAPKSRTYYMTAVGLYFGVCFVHERYMVLLPLFFIVLLLKKSRDIRQWLYPFASFVLVQVIRLLTIGGLSPAGTGGTQVADTFSLKQSIKYALSQVAYMFGINAGPEHLNGIPWKDSPFWIHGLVYGTLVFVLAMVVCFLVTAIRHKEERFPALASSILFICFIGACIVSSSVTIRVEMRWVYISYTAALLYLSYM